MSYTYPHYASQSPVASYQSAATITHYMEHVAGRQEHQEGPSEDLEAQEDHSPVITPGSRGGRYPIGYGSVPPRRRSSGSMPVNTPWTVHTSESSPLLSANPATAFDPPDERAAADGAWHPDSLLDGLSDSTPDSSTLEDFGDDNDLSAKRTLKEARVVASYAVPILITQLLEYSLLVASVISIGHLGTVELAASTLGSMTASVTGYSILVGMASALDSLLPQAWGGLGDQKRLVGLWTIRMTVVIGITLVPIYIIWHTSEDILLFLKQDPDVADLASLYLRWMSISLPAYSFNYVVRKYYQSIALLHIPSIIILIVAPLNAVLNYILVWGPGPFHPLRLGFIGAPIATSSSFILMSLLYAIHLLLWSPSEAVFPIKDRKSLQQVFSGEALGFLVRIGVAGVGQTASEWWSWELIGLAASMLGPVTLASQSVLLVSASTSYQLAFSITAGAAVRIGNLLGSGHAVQAYLSTNMSMAIVVLVSCFNSAVFLIFRSKWAYLFNGDPEVVSMVAKVLPLVGFFQILDGLSAMTGTVLRVTGRQFTGALLNLTGYYAIGIPLGLLLTFYFPDLHLGLLGLWIGLSVALLYTTFVGLTYTYSTNWHDEVERTRLRLKGGGGGRVDHGN